MTYFLDFDNTLFDSGAFKGYLAERLGYEALDGHFDEIFAGIEDGTLAFLPGELSRFVYPDVRAFLARVGTSAAVITYGNPSFQEAKVQSALALVPDLVAHYTNDVRKGHYLKDRIDGSADTTLVDDAPLELAILAQTSPQVRLFEMRRDGGAGDGRWPVLRSLTELP